MANVINCKSLGEFNLIKHLTELQKLSLPNGIPNGVMGPGDDCAIMPLAFFGADSSKGFLLLSTDSMIEEKHFSFNYSSPYDVGKKLVACNLSDIAAMAGTPKAMLINLQLNDSTTVDLAHEIYKGIYDSCADYGAYVIGGNTTIGKDLALTATIVGFSLLNPILRSTAKAGEDLWVSNTLGRAFLGLHLLKNKINSKDLAWAEETILAHKQPQPQLSLGQTLGSQNLASAMIDISDGLLQDASHIAESSSVEVEIFIDKVPVHPGYAKLLLNKMYAMTHGDDYELLFTSSQTNRNKLEFPQNNLSASENRYNLTRIGTIKETLKDQDLHTKGFVSIISADGSKRSLNEFLELNKWNHGAGYAHF